MQPLRTKTRQKKVQVGTRKVQKVKGWFTKTEVEVEEPVHEFREAEVVTEQSDVQVDLENLARRTQELCEQLERDGYEVIAIMPVVSGRYNYAKDWVPRSDWQVKSPRWGYDYGYGYGYGYGYSVTDGVVVTGRLRQ